MNWIARSLHRKLLILLMACIILPVMLLGYVSYRTAWSITEEKTKQANLNTLRQISAILETIAQDVENMSVFLIGQHDVQTYLAKKERASANDYLRMIGFLTNLAFSKDYIADIRIIPLNGNPELSNTTILTSSLFQQVPASPDYWEEHPTWWSPPIPIDTSLGRKRTVSLVRPIRNMNTFESLGMLSIGIDGDALTARLGNAVVEGGGSLILADNEGNIVASGADDATAAAWQPQLASLGGAITGNEAQFFDAGEGSGRHVVVAMKVPLAPWDVYAMIPYHTFSEQNRYVLQLTAVTVGVALLVIVAAVAYFVRRVTKPLVRLARSIGSVQPDSPFRPLPLTSQDEIGFVVRSYNRLSDNIRELTEQVKQNEAQKMKADLQALQAQIHPHFLYNTLSSVQWLAWMDGNGKIAEMVGALGDFLRFSLNRGLEYCTIDQEVEHVKNYMHIQAMRYPERFQFQIVLPVELEEAPMLKLLLQPLVENALLHGILKPGAHGNNGFLYLEMLMADEGGIQFIVRDNGVGMSPDAAESLRRQLRTGERRPPSGDASAGSGYGLFNVQRRLQLHYGEGASLHIDSIAGEGTTVTFAIPSPGCTYEQGKGSY